ncbi:MAG: AAA family ATPase [Methanobrevibacter sp. CfCl-M3]
MQEDIMNTLSLGLSEFDDIIKQGKVYVDKTRFIKKMMDQGRKYYFLSRPRRFGKTLLLSTLENFFNGKKERFKNTYIYNNWDDWSEYPVIRIYMNDLSNDSSEELKEDIFLMIENIAQKNNIKLSEKGSFIFKFKELIEKLAEFTNTKQIVVLIDEYDTPIIDNINNKKLADENRKILQNFYNVLKNSEEYIKFVFITGISKFTKTSIFSKFNNLTELTLDKDYSTICGISHEELKKHYSDHIQVLADENNYSFDEALERIDYFYDGYSWDGVNNVFNPNSTLRALAQKRFSSFWFSTGTPSFIAEIFKKRNITEDYFTPTVLKETELDAIDPDNINETTLLFQAGYLTVEEEFTKNNEIYFSLKIPNFEVEQAYVDNLKKLYLNDFKDKYNNIRGKLWDDINKGRCDNLANRLQDDININPSYLNIGAKENWKIYESMFLLWMNIMGFDVTGEKLIKHGRIDGVFKDYDNNHVVICEVKYNQSSSKSLEELIEEALVQLKDRRYWMGYTTRKISLMAIAFKDEIIYDDKTMTLVKCRIENFNLEQFLKK